MRFRKFQRITSSKDYRLIRNAGKRISAGAFHLQINKRDEDKQKNPSRIGIIASKRIGNAVIRNRAKRTFREIFRAEQKNIPSGIDIVLIVYPQFSSYSMKQLSEQFIYACQKYKKTRT